VKIEEKTDLALELEPREDFVRGLDTLTRAVQTTLGPAGQLVALQMKLGPPTYTKDGVTVADFVWSPHPVENSAIQTVIGAAKEMNARVGDGTTTAIILTVALAKQLLSLKGREYQEVIRHLRTYFNIASDAVKKNVRTIENDLKFLEAVAMISCNGDPVIAQVVADAVHSVGKDGVVTFQDSPTGDPYYEISTGMVFDRGYSTSAFLTSNDKQGKIDFGGTESQACLLFLSNDTLADAQDTYPILDAAHKMGQPVLIIAPDIVGNAAGMMIVNRQQGNAESCAVRAPGSGEQRINMMRDLAIATGGRVFSSDQGKSLKDMKDEVIEYFGKAGRVIVSESRTVIVDAGGEADQIEDHITMLRKAVVENPLESEKYQARIAQLTGGVGSVFVPGYNSAERIASRYFVEDGISACFAALRGGIVPGGGCSFKAMHKAVSEAPVDGPMAERAKEIFLKMVKRPLELLISNAIEGGTPEDQTFGILTDVLRKKGFNSGIDIRTMEVCDVAKRMIWEPVLVPLTALRIAFSCATTLGNTKAIINQRKDKK